MVLDLEKTKAREKRLLQRKAKLESDLARLQKKQKEAARRDDTRRKIVLGGVVVKAVRKGLLSTYAVREMVEQLASERDKAALADVDFGVSGTETPGAPAAADSANEFEAFERRE